MYRRAYVLLVGFAVLMGGSAIVMALIYDKRLVDPEGNFLGPSWLRLPLLLASAVVLDLLPRVVWNARLKPGRMPGIVWQRLRTHWNRERLTLVASGVVCFYVVYVSYRNLKSFLPVVRPDPDTPPGQVKALSFDHELHLLDRTLLFGHDPATFLHTALGTSVSPYVLSYVYLWFLPLVPLALTAWLVWSRNMSFGYWFATSQCIAWTLGTVSYYALPTLGPGIAYVSQYSDLPKSTASSSLMANLVLGRQFVLYGSDTSLYVEGTVNSVAGFASLHCAITLLMALMVQYTLRWKPLKIFFWVNFALTIIATLYFGWHYIADDLAGIMIAFVAFYLGGLASGQKFEHKGLASHPTTTTSAIPVSHD